MEIEEKIKNFADASKNLTVNELQELVLIASGLSLEECYMYLLIDPEILTDRERSFCKALHNRGRAIGIANASDKLFQHMATRNGGVSALEYLKSMSGDFTVDVAATPKSGFSFNVNIPNK